MKKWRGVGSDGSNISLNKCNVRIEQVSFTTKTLAYRLDYTVDPDIETFSLLEEWNFLILCHLIPLSLNLTSSNLNS